MDQSSCTAERHGRDVEYPYVAYYRNHCRCDDAREDWRLHCKRWREGRSHLREPALGYIRMVQALQAMGWPRWLQAEHAGLPTYALGRIHKQTWVHASTAQAIAALYLRLQNEDGPSPITNDRAWKAGYPPPGAWGEQDLHDPAAVPQCWSRPGDPDPVAAELVARQRARWTTLRPEERAEAYRLARRYGVSQRAMQADWHVSSRVLHRLDDEKKLSAA
jgi:hypothetical protein